MVYKICTNCGIGFNYKSITKCPKCGRHLDDLLM